MARTVLGAYAILRDGCVEVEIDRLGQALGVLEPIQLQQGRVRP